MLFGGGERHAASRPVNLAVMVRRRVLRVFLQRAGARIDPVWGGVVDVSMNRAPEFGRLPDGPAAGARNICFLQGFSDHALALTGVAGQLVAEAVVVDASRFDVLARLRHRSYTGGRWLRTPALRLGLAWTQPRPASGHQSLKTPATSPRQGRQMRRISSRGRSSGSTVSCPGFFSVRITPAIAGAATCRRVALPRGHSARACSMLCCEPNQCGPRA